MRIYLLSITFLSLALAFTACEQSNLELSECGETFSSFQQYDNDLLYNGNKIIPLENSESVVLGSTRSGDIFLAWFDETLEYTHSIKIDNYDELTPLDIKPTEDGGFILLNRIGRFNPFNEGRELMKLDSEGNRQWTRNLKDTLNVIPRQLVQVSENGHFIVGTIPSEKPLADGGIHIWRTNKRADTILWEKTYLQEDLQFHEAAVTSDGGVAFISTVGDTNFKKRWLLKVNENGEESWSFLDDDNPVSFFNTVLDDSSIATSSSGEIIVTYPFEFSESLTVPRIEKIDATGNVIWSYIHDIPEHETSDIKIIRSLTDGGYILADNISCQVYGSSDIFILLVKLSSNGQRIWARTYNILNTDYVTDLKETPSGNIMLLGSSWDEKRNPINRKFILFRTDADGNPF